MELHFMAAKCIQCCDKCLMKIPSDMTGDLDIFVGQEVMIDSRGQKWYNGGV